MLIHIVVQWIMNVAVFLQGSKLDENLEKDLT